MNPQGHCAWSSSRKSKPKQQGNYIDAFVKRMFTRIVVFVDFLLTYADPKFVAEIDLEKIALAPTHYIGHKGDERIIDLVFLCPLRNGGGSLTAVIIFEHESSNLKKIPYKLHRYISAIWDAEMKEGKKILSAPYFLVLRTGKKPIRAEPPTMAALLPKGRDGKPLGHVPEIKYDVVDLPSWDFSKLVGGTVLRLVLGMLHKMTGGRLDEFPEALQPLLEITDEGQKIELTKELIDFVDKAFAAHNRELDETVVSEVLKPILKGKERTMIKSMFEKREAIGEARGRAEEKIETGREMLLEFLRGRFGKVPKNIERAINQMNDPIALKSLAARTGNCRTLDEFAAEL
jgi:hypothetical protein